MNTRQWKKGLIILAIIVVTGLFFWQWQVRTVSAESQVQAAWQRVQRGDSYNFSADVRMNYVPLPTQSNIGRFSRSEGVFLEGQNDLHNETLQLALWGGAVSVTDRTAAYEVRVRDGQTETRSAAGEWEPSEQSSVSFAPEGDFLAFLDVATDVTHLGDAIINDQLISKYSFEIDSVAYANRLRSLTQTRMQQSGELPAGVAVQMPEHLANLAGTGELWIDARGLPVRQLITLDIPAATGTDYRTEAELAIDFSAYTGNGLALNWQQPFRMASFTLSNISLPSVDVVGSNVLLMTATLLLCGLLLQPRRRTLRLVNGVLLMSLLFAPLLQAKTAHAMGEKLVALKAEQETAQAETVSPLAAQFNIPQPGVPLASINRQTGTLDTDFDGLTDEVERLIGTNPYTDDSDFDGVSDLDEINGFDYGGQTWYGNPIWPDSNRDGILDGIEWNPDAPDSDGDNTPDLYDFDDDNDGVTDNVDMSRLVASKDDGGNLIAFGETNPLQLTIDGLEANRYTYVTMQLRPTNPDQLWYAFNVLNWPSDGKGNMQDWDEKSFFDVCIRTSPVCNMFPDDNGDIKLVPMLEVTVNDLSSLPRTASGALDEALLQNYGINVQPSGDGRYYLYVPLTLIEDTTTGNKIAFGAQLLYQTAATWQPQQVRLSWVVQVLNEVHGSPESATKELNANNGFGRNQQEILHAYYTDFHLTGLNVREDHGVEMAIVYEDPATDPNVSEDDALLQMTTGLNASFMINRDCDLVNNDGDCLGNGQRDITIPTVKQRFDRLSNSGTTLDQRWGIDRNRLRVETFSFAHDDEATMVGGGQIAAGILHNHFTGTSADKPSLLFVRESRFRNFNVDARTVDNNNVTWTGRNVQINMGSSTELITGSHVVAPYRYLENNGWVRQSLYDYMKELEARYPVASDDAPDPDAVTAGEQSAVFVVQYNAVKGDEAVLSQNGVSGLAYDPLTAGSSIRLQGVNLQDKQLRHVYTQALASASRAVPYLAKETMGKGWDAVTESLEKKLPEKFKPGDIEDFFDDKADEVYLQTVKNNFNAARVIYTGVLLGLIAAGILLTNFGNAAQTAGEILLSALTAINDTVDAAMAYANLSIHIKGSTKISQLTPNLRLTMATHRWAITSSVGKAAIIGAAIGVGVTWVLFFAAWGAGRLSVNSTEFNNLLAGTIATTLVVVLNLIFAFSVVGLIAQAVIAVIDLITLIICKAGVKLACSLGITESMTKLISEWLYTGGLMIDMAADPAITNIENATMRLAQPEKGLVAGNSVRFQVKLLSHVRHAVPDPGIIYHYSDFFTPQDLASSTVKYTLDTTKRNVPSELNQTGWSVRYIGTNTAEVPSPVVGWLIPTIQAKDLYRGVRFDQLTSGRYDFTTAKINQEFPLYLNTGMTLPRYDCWFQVCVHKSAKSSVNTDLGKNFILDILPATLDEFVAWSALGSQVDQDGDGVLVGLDPHPHKPDTDGDGVPDGRELSIYMDPASADFDNDGLTDDLEMRYGSHTKIADTDGDGLTDLEEINGYMLTFGGRAVHVVSNPAQRDSDADGMSDGVEKRLNELDSVAYPFNPSIINQAPLHLFTVLDDADNVLAIGDRTVITTTVLNGTALDSGLLAMGELQVALPAELGGASETKGFALLPSLTETIVLEGVAALGERYVGVNMATSADLIAYGSRAFSDIILDDIEPVTIDNDDPYTSTLTLGEFVQPGRQVVIGGNTSDPTSYISLVEVSVNNGAFEAAEGTEFWAYTLDIPDIASGSVPIQVRATDAVSHTTVTDFDLVIDGTSPEASIDLTNGDVKTVRRNADGAWTLALNGSSSDALAGIKEATLHIGSSSIYSVPDPDGAWTIDYPFDDSAFNADPRPTDAFTLTMTVRDNALPDGNVITQVVPFVIDMTAPVVDLQSHESDRQLTDGAVLTGTVRDDYASVTSVEYAFVNAATVFETENTLLQLPFNDLPETVLFGNFAQAATSIFCLDEFCPTSGVAGTDGTAVSFDGVDDVIRNFEPLDLPESGLTTALWFKTTCADCGLFSVVATQFPPLDGYDRSLYLNNGTVCSYVFLSGGQDYRCSIDTYNDDNWHQVVHTLGSNGNHLYIDGELVVSSPSTTSAFTWQQGVTLGHSLAATNPFFAGSLDDVVIYDGTLSADSVAALYRRWQPATLNGETWSFTVPADLEGYYQLDMRATDSVGNRNESRGDWPQFRGPIDTQFPTVDVAVQYSGGGSAALTSYAADVRDLNLTADGYSFLCGFPTGDQLRYETDPAQLAYTGLQDGRLNGISADCLRVGFQSTRVVASACDTFGHCTTGTPAQLIGYVGTERNTTLPYGSLPNGIDRVELDDPDNRIQIIARPGKVIEDIEVDQLHGKLYWAESAVDPADNAVSIWRANLDGSAPQKIIDAQGFGYEDLTFALDPLGNKIYWAQRYQLYWANLDGSLQEVVYSIPDDPRFTDGAQTHNHIGDVVVDNQNGKLYLTERRYRIERNSTAYAYKHSLVVEMSLNGTDPTFIAGVGDGCTYANFYENLGPVDQVFYPSACLPSGSDGFDVDALAVSDGTLYWTAIDADSSTEGGVYGRSPGEAPFLVARLSLPYQEKGVRQSAHASDLYINPASGAAFVMQEIAIVRGERGGTFSIFSGFTNTTAPVGIVARGSSKLTALAIVRTAGTSTQQTDTDLAVSLTSPDVVLLENQLGSYQATVRNISSVTAQNTVVTFTLPDDVTFFNTSPGCNLSGDTVVCTLGAIAPYETQKVRYTFNVAPTVKRVLEASVSVATSSPDGDLANNSATNNSVTITPSLADLPGLPYIYYSGGNNLMRVPLFGDNEPEPLFFGDSSHGVHSLASSPAGDKLYVNTWDDELSAVNPSGTGYAVLIPETSEIPTNDHFVAVDQETGQLYWNQRVASTIHDIMRSEADGSNVTTIAAGVKLIKGLAVDDVRGKLYWVGADFRERQELIYRSDFDGSEVEVVYRAEIGRKLRFLAVDPYNQKLYWYDPDVEGGSLFWADSNGQNVAAIQEYIGGKAGGLIVRPNENAIYHTNGDALGRSELDGSNFTQIADLSLRPYLGVNNLGDFPFLSIAPEIDTNLAYAISEPYPPSPCVPNDTFEPNDTAASATALVAGTYQAALCSPLSDGRFDIDYYSVSVAAGDQLTATLRDLPSEVYGLYVMEGDQVVKATRSAAAGQTVTLLAPNYGSSAVDYTLVVYGSELINNVDQYTLDVVIDTAPPQSAFTDAQCQAVDPHDAPGLAGNGSQANATPLTIGTPISGALCYQFDTDFYSFSGVAGQTVSFDLPVSPAEYELHVYRPNGSYLNAFGPSDFGTPQLLDETGTFAVAVIAREEAPMLDQYTLLVSNDTCAVNDSHEPNNVAAQSSDIAGTSRVFATLCNANDADFYSFTATAGQQLTVNYPANDAAGTLTLSDANDLPIGAILPGTRAVFQLTAGGTYYLSTVNTALASDDLAYMFQWQVSDPVAASNDTDYIYYGDYPHLVRVALSEDHTVEPLLIDGGIGGSLLAADLTRGKLFMVEAAGGPQSLISSDFDGTNRTVLVTDANPDDVATLSIAVAVAESDNYLYWTQPRGASASTAGDIKRVNIDGSGSPLQIADVIENTALLVDQVKGTLYWVSQDAILSSDLDGGNQQTIRAAVSGERVQDLTLDPLAQELYWIDGANNRLVRRNLLDDSETVLVTGLDTDARGIVALPERNELYYSSGTALHRANSDGTNPVQIATLSGSYIGPSNLDANTNVNIVIGTSESNLVLAVGSPIVSPCALADGNEPNDDIGSATPLTVVTETITYGALCSTDLGATVSDADYYRVEVANGKVLSATLSELSADYKLIIIHPDGYAAAFSETPGLADEFGVIENRSGATQTYHVVVTAQTINSNNPTPYKLTLELGNVPPPSADACADVDPYDAPDPNGNGTLATATPLTFDTPYAAALCYTDDVDMYAFDGLNGQSIQVNLPTRPEDYTVTLYDPSGTPTTVISSTTSPAYGESVVLTSDGVWTVGVSQPNLLPTTAQYQLIVSDENCVDSDSFEPNNSESFAAAIANGNRVRATLCSAGDVDLYTFTASNGQQLTLNVPVNPSGASLRVYPQGGGDLGTVTAGSQAVFNVSDGVYFIEVQNGALADSDVPYFFQMLLGAPATPPSGSPYLYNSTVNSFVRVDVITKTVEPILLDNSGTGGPTVASDLTRGKLFVRTHQDQIARVNANGTGFEVVVANTNPAGLIKPRTALAVDEQSGRIYWTEGTFGVVSRIMSANGDGSDVQEVVANVVDEHALAVDTVTGRLYWAATNTQFGRDVIGRANLDGSDQQIVYAAPVGRNIRDLAIDPYTQMLYWRDPSQQRLLAVSADGGTANAIVALGAAGRGLVVLPLENTIYFSAGDSIRRADLNGGNVSEITRQTGQYAGVSNLDPNVFVPRTFVAPTSNLVLAYGVPYRANCLANDILEPNNTLATAASITAGTFSAAHCTADLNNADTYDYYKLTVASGKQIRVALNDSPQTYTLVLFANGQGVSWNYQAGIASQAVTHSNNSGAPIEYTVGIQRTGGTNGQVYTVAVDVSDAPPPPPPPPPPPDACADFDVYDAPGAAGNGSRGVATPINYNTDIVAALCYANDYDYYAFEGLLGENITLDLPTRPADYSLSLYDPSGKYVTGIFPGSSLSYGDAVPLNASGTWKVVVWDPYLTPTTEQYTLRIGNGGVGCVADAYEPNDFVSNFSELVTTPVTESTTFLIEAALCDNGAFPDDTDGFQFVMTAGQSYHFEIKSAAPDLVFLYSPQRGGFGEFEGVESGVISADYEVKLLVRSADDDGTHEPYVVEVRIDPRPAPTPVPNNWSCTTYTSGAISGQIADFGTLGLSLNVPADGTVTHVGLRDLTFQHGYLGDLSFGLTAPNGTTADLFAFDDYNRSYDYCGDDPSTGQPFDCRLSLDDAAMAGLQPPQFPNNGDTYRPNRSSFAPFNGLASSGNWTLLVSDDGGSYLDDDTGDTSGIVKAWGLEVCIDNGQVPTPPPTPTATPTAPPTPDNGIPPTPTPTPSGTPTAVPTSCVVTAADGYESDNTFGTASLFDVTSLSSPAHTFHSTSDADWIQFNAEAGARYTFAAVSNEGRTGVGLAIFQANGTTLIKSENRTLTFTPTTSGTYYLRATWSLGNTVACSAAYGIALDVVNPNVTPVPTPSGTPVPPDHNAPPVSAGIVAPADRLVLTAVAQQAVDVGLSAGGEIQGATFSVNEAVVDTFTPARRSADPQFDLIWSTSWTPTEAGVYRLSADISGTGSPTATETLTGTSPVTTVFIDLANPTVSLVAETITLAQLQGDQTYLLHGTATDDSQIDRVEVRIAGGAWQPAALRDGDVWELNVAPQSLANPNGGTILIEVRATDVAGRTDSTSDSVLVDVVPPDPFDIVTALQSGGVITGGQVVTERGVQVTWPDVAGAVTYYAGYTSSPTATQGTLTQFATGDTRTQTIPEASTRYAHVMAVDVNGNATVVTAGPYYIDTPATPDLIDDLTFVDWIISGGKQVAQMANGNYGVQKLYVGWDANQLRLRWDGFNVESSGDLFFYLGTGGSGLTTQLAPYGGTPADTLPISAEYVVHVSNSTTATLYSVSGGVWTSVAPAQLSVNGQQMDILLAFADLGITTRAATSLQLLGVATGEGSVDVLATLPDKNIGQTTWNQFITFSSMGSGIIPSDGVWADVDLSASVSANPDPAALVGIGDAVTVTVAYSLTGSAGVGVISADATTSGGLTIANAPQSATNQPANSSGTLTLLGTVNGDGAVDITLSDSYHRPYDLTTISYAVDTVAPISVTLELGAVRSYTNTILASAEDDSPIASIEVEIDNGARAATLVACTPTGTVDSFTCEWNAGVMTDGATYDLRGRATDIHGNVSAWSAIQSVVADTTLPTLTLSAAANTALSDGKLNSRELLLTGSLTDNLATAAVRVCSTPATAIRDCSFVAADAANATTFDWTAGVIASGDSITTELEIVGFDVAGNASITFTRVVTIDTVRPIVGSTLVATGVVTGTTPVQIASGSATDGSGIASVTVVMVQPDRTVAQVNATVNGNDWSAEYAPSQAGRYQLLLVITDGAGNRRTAAGGILIVNPSESPLDLTRFTAHLQANGDVWVDWETSAERNLAGYYVYRSTTQQFGDAVQLNAQIIPATGNARAATYRYVDVGVMDSGWYYWLEAVDNNDVRSVYGPVMTSGDPTAVGIGSGFADAHTATERVLVIAVVLVALTAFGWRREVVQKRRR